MSYSDVRLFIRPISRDVVRDDIIDLFKGYGKIVEIKLMTGFGFIEFESARDAQDVVSEFNNKEFMGDRLQLEFAKRRREREDRRDSYRDRDGGRDFRDRRESRRPRRSGYRIQVSDLPGDCSWQDLKDFARRADVDVLYADVSRDRDGTGVIDVERQADLDIAMEKLANEDIKGVRPTLKDEVVDMSHERSPSPYRRGSPPPRRSYGDRRYDDRGDRGDRGGYRRRDRSRSPRRGDYGRRGGDRYERRDRGDRDRGDRGDRGDRRDRGEPEDRDREDRDGGDDGDVPPPPAPAGDDAPAGGDWERDDKGDSGDHEDAAPAGGDEW